MIWRRKESMALSLLYFSSFALLLAHVEATIRILDSGRDYRSWPDHEVGLRLTEGEIYKARLQEIKGNSHLCSLGQNWNITVPEDGLPVALMVKKGVCSIETKAKYASKYIQPAGIVKFLIIDGDHHIAANEQDENDDFDVQSTTPSYLNAFSDMAMFDGSASSTTDYGDSMISSTTSFDLVSRALRQNKKHSKKIEGVTVSILHVTYATGYSMLELLLREIPSVQAAGGLVLELTADSPSDKEDKIRLIWLLTVALMGVSCCLCLLNVISSIMEAAEPALQPAARPRRQRLTPWQVRKKFPVGAFDGTHLHFSPRRQYCRQNSDEVDEKEEEILSLSSAERVSQGDVRNPVVLTDDTCIICLDDYVIGDKLRCLPCDHSFHSTCITKWLTERSATCPLCKIDLYESDDEEEDQDSHGGLAPLSSSWNSVPPETRTVQSEQTSQERRTDTTTGNTTEIIEHRWPWRGRAFGTWGRTFFRRPTSAISPTISLTEPLLVEGTTEGSGIDPTNVQIEERPAAGPICPSETPPTLEELV